MSVKSRISVLLVMLFSLQITVSAQQKDNFEFRMLRNIADTRTDGKNNFFKNYSKFNNAVCLLAPATVFVTGLAEKDSTLKKKALYLTESIAASQFVTWGMKITIRRDRPFVTDTSFKPVIYSRNKSFPSGHTSEAFAMATSLTLAFPKWYVAVPAFTYAALQGYSRLYLGVHYPTDVLAGALVGSGSAWLMYKLNKWMNTKKKKG